MALLGLKCIVAAIATDNGSSIAYSNGRVLAKALTADISINSNDVALRADDADDEVDTSFSDGTIAYGINDLDDDGIIMLRGYTEGAEVDPVTGAKELSTAGAAAPHIGTGFYAQGVKNKVPYWSARWFIKTQFKEPSESHKTKQRTPEFLTPAIEGSILTASWDSTYWKEQARFSTEDGAIAWLYGKAGISTTPSNNITALTITNGTLTPTFAAGTYNYSCACTGNIDLTATFAAGTAKVYIDGVYSHTLATTVKGSSITMAAGNNKIIQIIVQESGKPAVTYTIMAQRTA